MGTSSRDVALHANGVHGGRPGPTMDPCRRPASGSPSWWRAPSSSRSRGRACSSPSAAPSPSGAATRCSPSSATRSASPPRCSWWPSASARSWPRARRPTPCSRSPGRRTSCGSASRPSGTVPTRAPPSRRSRPARWRRLPPRRSLRIGFIVGLTNPKTIVFFVAFLPQFVNEPAGHAGPSSRCSALVFGAMAVAVRRHLGAGGQQGPRLVRPAPAAARLARRRRRRDDDRPRRDDGGRVGVAAPIPTLGRRRPPPALTPRPGASIAHAHVGCCASQSRPPSPAPPY